MSGVRTDWLGRIDADVERLTDDLAAVDVRQAAPLLTQFLETVDAPPDALHGAALSSVLMDVCGRVVHALHDQNPPVDCRCEATIWSHVGRFAEWRQHDPRAAFRNWLHTFFADIEREHPSDSAVRAAEIIRQDPARAWTSDGLAAAVDTRPTTLRREFELRFGMRPAAYVHLARVALALTRLRGSAKVEAVAWDVGYRSKKDLYAALGRWAGSTPTALRALSDEECAWLARELRIRCLRGIATRNDGVRVINAADARSGGPESAGTRGFRR